MDLKDFYLNTPLDRPEFLRMTLEYFLDNVIKQYNVKEKVDAKGFVILQVEEGMYGLPCTGIVTHNLFQERLGSHEYTPSNTTQ